MADPVPSAKDRFPRWPPVHRADFTGLTVHLTRFGAGLWTARSHRAHAETAPMLTLLSSSEEAPFYCTALSTEHSLQLEPMAANTAPKVAGCENLRWNSRPVSRVR